MERTELVHELSEKLDGIVQALADRGELPRRSLSALAEKLGLNYSTLKSARISWRLALSSIAKIAELERCHGETCTDDFRARPAWPQSTGGANMVTWRWPTIRCCSRTSSST